MIPRVYIAGPYSAPSREGREDNFHRAVAVGAAVLAAGCHPVIPHATGILLEHIEDSYEFWIEATLRELRTCDACVMVPNWQSSKGSVGEHADCLARGVPVFEVAQVGGLPPEFQAWAREARR